jgi:nucleoside-diphosphate-sugar epimerase
MRVLILGGTRFIGWHIASTLKSEGHRVAVFHRGSTPLRELSGIEEILGEKTKLPGFRDEFQRLRPEAVIDCIGYTPTDGAKIVERIRLSFPRKSENSIAKKTTQRIRFLAKRDSKQRCNVAEWHRQLSLEPSAFRSSICSQ